MAAEKYEIKSLALAWWVSANENLKHNISSLVKEKGCTFIHPVKPVFSQDNAAMVGILAYHKIISDNI
jgi:tRNA A37 threonylcarbamoyltransferase TsaD